MYTAQPKVMESLTGKLLIAMPHVQDPRFQRSVIYVCVHNGDGAMGLIVNRNLDNMTFDDLLAQVKVNCNGVTPEVKLHFGGPVESGRGFILHSNEYRRSSTHNVANDVSLTATVEVLEDIAQNTGPQRHILALGYAGWGGGQLENELQENSWLVIDADPDILFNQPNEHKWSKAVGCLGFDINLLAAGGTA